MSVAKLTEKQKRFVQEYLVDLNATAAAKRAGYKDPNIGRQLIAKNNVSAEIQKRQVKLQNKLKITQERVLSELAAIAFANGTDFATVNANGLINIKATSQVPKEKLPAVASIKYSRVTGVEIKLHDKVRALEMLGKHLGLFDNRSTQPETEENNIFEIIDQSTRGELDISEISEIEPPAKSGDDLVE